MPIGFAASAVSGGQTGIELGSSTFADRGGVAEVIQRTRRVTPEMLVEKARGASNMTSFDIVNWSIWFDLKIKALTFFTVLLREYGTISLRIHGVLF
jgi:hypothetical protein